MSRQNFLQRYDGPDGCEMKWGYYFNFKSKKQWVLCNIFGHWLGFCRRQHQLLVSGFAVNSITSFAKPWWSWWRWSSSQPGGGVCPAHEPVTYLVSSVLVGPLFCHALNNFLSDYSHSSCLPLSTFCLPLVWIYMHPWALSAARGYILLFCWSVSGVVLRTPPPRKKTPA